MDLRFTTPQLRKLDLAGTEVLVAALAADEQPPRGVAGLVDWRLVRAHFPPARIAALPPVASGEVLLVPGKPKLPFDKVVLFGIGDAAVVLRARVSRRRRARACRRSRVCGRAPPWSSFPVAISG